MTLAALCRELDCQPGDLFEYDGETKDRLRGRGAIGYAVGPFSQRRSRAMGNTYKKIELTGTSKTSIEDAINIALKKSSESVRNMRWFEVTELRGAVDGDKVSEWQVTVKVGFTVD